MTNPTPNSAGNQLLRAMAADLDTIRKQGSPAALWLIDAANELRRLAQVRIMKRSNEE